MSMRRALCIGLTCYATTGLLVAAEPSPPAKDVAEVYAWFDTLELPDVATRPYVEVRLAVPRLPNGDPYDERDYRDRVAGFLLAEDKTSLTVWTHDLYRLTIPRNEIIAAGNGLPYQASSLGQTSRRLLEEHPPPGPRLIKIARTAPEAPPENRDYIKYWKSDEPTSVAYCADLNPLAELLLTAWLCRRLGTPEHVESLERRADEHREAWSGHGPLREGVAMGISYDLHQRLLMSLRLRRVTWKDALRQCEWLLKHIPDEEIRDETAKLAAPIRRLIQTTRPAEECRRLDAEIAAIRKAGGPWRPEHAEYLIYSLRDYNENDDDAAAPSPLETLTAMGDVGLAALIDHIDDDALTRCVRYHSFTGDFSAMTVGLQCHRVLPDHDLPSDVRTFVHPDEPPAERAAVKARLRKALLNRNLKPNRRKSDL